MGAEFLFMDDNARPLRANIIDECLQSEDITRMDWPAYSPDLNPIEHVVDMLGRRIAAFNPLPPIYRNFGVHCLMSGKRYYYKKLQVLLRNLRKNIKDFEGQEKRKEEKVIDDFISIMDSLIKEFSARFSQFKELSETFKFIMYPDVISFNKLNLSQFDRLEIEELEIQLIDFQSSSIWAQKFIETRKKLEMIEAERLTSNISKNTSNEILETWNLVPDEFNCLKKLAYAILTIFSSTYACESLFSEINNIKDSCQVIYSQFSLAIHQNDHQARRRFVEWAQNEIAVVPDFHKRILFSDEAYFWLNGCVNKQNCRIWSEANPQVYVETPLHPEKLTVWCALWADGIIGP
ncbi:dimer_Tnp_hAT domain-containing protein [Trichonephila clavipes]|nr:dimer_Tnp_hAT domain-containing protein [Trichonephila clavipes]